MKTLRHAFGAIAVAALTVVTLPAPVAEAAPATPDYACSGAFALGQPAECTFRYWSGRISTSGTGVAANPWVTVRTAAGKTVIGGCSANTQLGVVWNCSGSHSGSGVARGSVLTCRVHPLFASFVGTGTFTCQALI